MLIRQHLTKLDGAVPVLGSLLDRGGIGGNTKT
jgi:hypothetical protein